MPSSSADGGRRSIVPAAESAVRKTAPRRPATSGLVGPRVTLTAGLRGDRRSVPGAPCTPPPRPRAAPRGGRPRRPFDRRVRRRPADRAASPADPRLPNRSARPPAPGPAPPTGPCPAARSRFCWARSAWMVSLTWTSWTGAVVVSTYAIRFGLSDSHVSVMWTFRPCQSVSRFGPARAPPWHGDTSGAGGPPPGTNTVRSGVTGVADCLQQAHRPLLVRRAPPSSWFSPVRRRTRRPPRGPRAPVDGGGSGG